MLPKGYYFPGQRRDEQVILFVRRHWLSFLPWIIFVIILVLLPILAYYNWKIIIFESIKSRDFVYFVVVLSAYYLIVLAIFLTAWLEFYLNVLIITPEHLVDIRQEGLFNRRVSEQSLLRVQDVSAHMKGMLQTFFLYGTVLVETAGEAPNFVMPNIPFPSKVANTILKLHEELVKKSGFEEEDLASGVGLDFHLQKFRLDNKISQSKKVVKNNSAITVEDKVGKVVENKNISSANPNFINNSQEGLKTFLKEKKNEGDIYKANPSVSKNISNPKKEYSLNQVPLKQELTLNQVPESKDNTQNPIVKENTLDTKFQEGELKEGEIVNL